MRYISVKTVLKRGISCFNLNNKLITKNMQFYNLTLMTKRISVKIMFCYLFLLKVHGKINLIFKWKHFEACDCMFNFYLEQFFRIVRLPFLHLWIEILISLVRREEPGSILGRSCQPSRSEFSVVFSETRVSTG